MTVVTSFSDTGDKDLYDRIASALTQLGYIILDSALPEPMVTSLFVHYQSINARDFDMAGTGRELDHQINPFVRTDEIYWLDRSNPVTTAYLTWSENLRLELNRRLFLGLFDYECHYAWYPTGAFYKKHLDAFTGNTNRVISTVLYLNPSWNTGDGGELLMYRDDESEPFEIIAPIFGRLVLFLSEEFPHEVVKTTKPRRSLAGWYRINTTTYDSLDPPR